ncbi:MAG: ABC transporter permease [Microthrixaceae bacterium]
MTVASTPGAGVDQLDRTLEGLDRLEVARPRGPSRAHRCWSVAWPKLAGVGVALVLWQAVVSSGWKPDYVLPGPVPVLGNLAAHLGDGSAIAALGRTMSRAAVGFSIATLAGAALGLAVARSRVLRAAVGSMITGLQTMPSIAWFPLSILLFGVSESAILFVVVMGAAPSIANGIVAGVDQVPPQLDRVGTIMGARGLRRVRHVLLPAAMPQMLAALKQGWAFAWRSLMAGELIVVVAGQESVGAQLQHARDLADSVWMMSTMLLILCVGIAVDAVLGAVERSMLRRRGLAVARND